MLEEITIPEAFLDIKQWGNNLDVRLFAAVAREAHLPVGQRVRVLVEGDQVIITPTTKLTLEQRLAVYDPKRHGGEPMATAQTPGKPVTCFATSPNRSIGVCARRIRLEL